jgi:hypothetical protein
MDSDQVKLLASLAKKIRTEKKDKASIVASFQSAKILTKSGNFTNHYSNLKKLVSISE